jgi:hypothetical protein
VVRTKNLGQGNELVGWCTSPWAVGYSLPAGVSTLDFGRSLWSLVGSQERKASIALAREVLPHPNPQNAMGCECAVSRQQGRKHVRGLEEAFWSSQATSQVNTCDRSSTLVITRGPYVPCTTAANVNYAHVEAYYFVPNKCRLIIINTYDK